MVELTTIVKKPMQVVDEQNHVVGDAAKNAGTPTHDDSVQVGVDAQSGSSAKLAPSLDVPAGDMAGIEQEKPEKQAASMNSYKLRTGVKMGLRAGLSR